jgi:hypothetical protein
LSALSLLYFIDCPFPLVHAFLFFGLIADVRR